MPLRRQHVLAHGAEASWGLVVRQLHPQPTSQVQQRWGGQEELDTQAWPRGGPGSSTCWTRSGNGFQAPCLWQDPPGGDRS